MNTYFILLACCLIATASALTLSAQQKEKLKKHNEECHRDVKIDPQIVLNARKGQFDDGQLLKDYVFCVLRKSDLVDERGILKESVLMAKLPKDTNMLAATVITELCKSQGGANPAERSYRMYRCYYEATPMHVSLI